MPAPGSRRRLRPTHHAAAFDFDERTRKASLTKRFGFGSELGAEQSGRRLATDLDRAGRPPVADVPGLVIQAGAEVGGHARLSLGGQSTRSAALTTSASAWDSAAISESMRRGSAALPMASTAATATIGAPPRAIGRSTPSARVSPASPSARIAGSDQLVVLGASNQLEQLGDSGRRSVVRCAGARARALRRC